MSKQLIRQKLLNQRRELESSSCARFSSIVQDYFIASRSYAEAKTIAIYSSVHNEVRTDRLFERALADGKQVCFPRLEADHIVFVAEVDALAMQVGPFGVPEPQGQTVVSPEDIDLVAVPGVGFDRQGHRIGYGLGYYDRALKACTNAEFIGLAYSSQVVGSLPAESHDIRLDYLATENEIIEFKHKQEHLENGGRT